VSAACQNCSDFHYDVHTFLSCSEFSILGTKRRNGKGILIVSSNMRHTVYIGHYDRAVKEETDWLTNYLTLWSWALLEGQPVLRPLDSFLAFYGTRRFITEFTRALHLFLSWARLIQSNITPSHFSKIHNSNLVSIFRRLGSLSKESVQVRDSTEILVTNLFWRDVSSMPNPKLEDHLLLFVRDCLFNIFAANLHYRRPFLHPQPEDAPCCGDRDPPDME
jgi:hypothetical protein